LSRLRHAPAASAGSALNGILIFMAASFSFACMDTLAKHAAARVHVIEVTWGRYFFSLLFLGLLLGRGAEGGSTAVQPSMLQKMRSTLLPTSQQPLFQIVRSAILLGVTLLFFTGISYLPLVDAVAIGHTTPLMITALASLALGEKVGGRRWAAVGIGFAGVLVVIRPGLGVMHWAAFIMLGAAILNALYHLSTRVLASVDKPETTIVYTGLVGAAVLTVSVPFVWTNPDIWSWVELAACGFFGFLGHYLLAMAYARAPASTLAPYTYIITIWLGLLGYFVFGNIPDLWTLIGCAIIVGSGLYIYHCEAQLRRIARAAPQTAEEIVEVG
jgi:drug/metabolite transporter (DMT)-like permease